MSILDNVKFWAQAIEESKRTLVCSPENESRVKSYVDARGLSGLYEVLVTPNVPDDLIVVMDQNAIEASTRQRTQPHRWSL